MGERHLRPARRLPGDGRRRQGLDDQARHVRRQPAGRAGRLVQATVERGARPHVPVADRQGGARAGPDRDLQPLALRGGRRPPGAPGVARARSTCRPATAGPSFWAGRYDDLNAFEQPPRPQRHRRSSSSSSTSRRRSRSGASWRASTTPTRSGSSTPPTSPSAPHWDDYMQAYEDAITRDVDRRGRRGTCIPADHKHVMQAMAASILVDTIDSLDLQWPTVSDAERAGQRRSATRARSGTRLIDHAAPRRGEPNNQQERYSMLLAEFGTGQVFWSMLWFFLFFIWIWLLISLFGDIFRSDDLSGWSKALWTIFVIVLPFLGVFVYLIVRGNSMQERALKQAADQEAQFRRLRADGRSHGRRRRCRRARQARRPARQGRHQRRRVPGRQGQGPRLSESELRERSRAIARDRSHSRRR